jgi:hypothetical protein
MNNFGRETKHETTIMEPHFTVKELAESWNVSDVVVFRMFQDEPGVMRLGSTSTRRRVRRELRIPQSVAERVYASRLNRG